MRIALLLAAWLGGANGSAQVIQSELFDAFQSLCPVDPLSAEALASSAAKAGFKRSPVEPVGSENRETAAWTRGGIRLFTTSGQSNPAWPLPPMCGVAAELYGRASPMRVARALAARIGGAAILGSPGPRHASLNLLVPRRMVHLAMNRSHRGGSSIMLLAYPPQEKE